MPDKLYCKLKYTKKISAKETLIATAEIKSISGQAPYFSITAELYEGVVRDSNCVAGGQLTELVAQHFPALAYFHRWHCAAVGKGPMHYVENSLYWAGKSGWCDGEKNSPPNAAYFASTCVYGALPSDNQTSIQMLMDAEKPALKQWLESRLGALLEVFYDDMAVLFGEQFQLTR